MGRDLKVRIAIGDSAGTQSPIWVVSTAKNEVYAAHRTRGGIEKISFHQSRVCRRAFTTEYGVPSGMTDRVIQRWIRPETQPASSSTLTRLLSVSFPASHVSASVAIAKPTILLDSAAPGRSKNFDVALTNDLPATATALVEQGLAHISAKVCATHQMPNGETLLVFSTETENRFGDLIMPAGLHEPDDLVFPSGGPTGEAPSLFLTVYREPKDGDCLMCIELAGFRVPDGQAQMLFPNAGCLTRTRVLDRQPGSI